jgi:hypothetical protein
VPTAALADGGKTIAGATPATFGQQEFGNTATGGQSPGQCSSNAMHYRSWWNVGVSAGDLVTIDWGTQLTGLTLDVY